VSPDDIRTWDYPMMDAKEIANILKISPKTIYYFNNCNRMPKASKLGRSLRWIRREIMLSIENGTFGRFQK
jgi:predicted DNA-binding transcriptional regulator AlpA